MALGERKREARRLKVITAARRLIADRGYDAVTVRDLADEAGVAVATIYNQFGSKNGIIIAAVEEIFAREVDPKVHAESLRGLDLVLLGAQRTASIVDVDAEFPRALAVELARDSEASAELQQAFSGMHFSQVRAGLEQMATADELEPWIDIDVLTEIIVLQSSAATRAWAVNDRTSEWLRHRTALGAAMLLHGISRSTARERLVGMVETLHKAHVAAT